MPISSLGAMLPTAVLLCFACGQTERNAATASESPDITWTFGDELNTVISAPVEGADGLVYVAVGSRNVARATPEQPALPYTDEAIVEIRVVALDQSGVEHWRSVPTCDPMWLPTERATLTTSPNGDTLVVCNREAVRVDSGGNVKWHVDISAAYAAVGEDGVAYALVRTGDLEHVGAGTYSLAAFDVNGQRKWTSTELLTVSYSDLNVGTVFGPHTSTIVGSDAVYAPCDRCADNQAGLARIEPDNGETTLVGSIDGTPGEFGTLAARDDDVYATVGISLMTYQNGEISMSSDQVLTAWGLSPVLVAKEGPVYLVSNDGFRLRIGDRVTGPFSAGANAFGPMALMAPNLVLLGNGQVIDYEGDVIFTIDGVDVMRHPPLIEDGTVLVTTKAGVLQRRELPIQGLEPDAPWPVVGGDSKNAHRAR